MTTLPPNVSRFWNRAVLVAALGTVGTLGFLSCGSDGGTKTEDPITGPVLRTLIGTGYSGLDTTTTDPAQTRLYLPVDIAFDEDDTPYIVDWNNHRILAIEAGVVRRVIGTGIPTDDVVALSEGPALEVNLNHPTHISFAPNGELILSAWHNSKVMRLIEATQFLKRECGNGQRAFGGDGGPAGADTVKLNLPSSTAFDAQGQMYISDQQNQRIRMVDVDGIIHTVVNQSGVGAYSGDGGPALVAQVRWRGGQSAQPSGRVVISPAGDLYIADTGNNLIRKVSGGIITTVAGDTTGARASTNAGFSGDGGPATSAKLNAPSDIDIGPDGNLYIADTRNMCVRMVDMTTGIITTVVGKGGNPGSDGDGRHATDGRLNTPYGIAFDREGTLYIADTYNHRIRFVK